jgi:putative Ca2+/H+ antiporter (TMEM165/GDT1 family)
LHPFIVSLTAVGLGEIGDKTQLLAMVLAARYQRPVELLSGILAGTLLSHLLAGLIGEALHSLLVPDVLNWIVGLSLLAVAAWTLVPDKIDEEAEKPASRWGLFWIAAVSLFVAEIGDKTQIATALLAARFDRLLPVVAGATIGMMCAQLPAVLLGRRLAERVPMIWIHRAAALVFAAQGVAVLMGYGSPLR